MTNHHNFIVRNAVTGSTIASFKSEIHARKFVEAANLPPIDIELVLIKTSITETVIDTF